MTIRSKRKRGKKKEEDEQKLQTEIPRNAKLKKSSMSGWAKKAIGLLCNKQFFDATLRFFGAGGQVLIAGIRNLRALGVEQLPPVSAAPSMSGLLSEELVQEEGVGGGSAETSRFFGFRSLFLRWVLLGLVGDATAALEFPLDLLLLVLPIGAIGRCSVSVNRARKADIFAK